MSGSFERTSLGWQVWLWQRQVAEWWERSFPRLERIGPWSLPPWLLTPQLYQALAGLLLLFGLWQLYRALSPYLNWSLVKSLDVIPFAGRALPREMTVNQWLARSQTLAAQGNYREACRALYYATIQRLDQTGLITNHPSRTDGEYLNLVQSLPSSDAFQCLFHTHEQLHFSQAAVSADTFSRCQAAYQAIAQLAEVRS